MSPATLTFAELFEKSTSSLAEGSLVKGTIVAIKNNQVMVDIGYKAEGLLDINEFAVPEDAVLGAEVEVLFESFDDKNGLSVVSKRKADRQRTWNEILSTAQEGTIVDGRITRKVRGGLMVDVGMDAFLPASLLDVKPVRNVDALLGLRSKFVIVKINHKRKNIVVSRKDFLEKERHVLRSERLGKLNVNDVITGKAKNITDFGVFVDLGDIDGLLHITDMCWGRISHPSEMVKVGEEIEVVVIGVDREKNKVSLGLKQKSKDPWVLVDEKYSIGNQVHGRVVNILPYGAFVELEPGIEGLVHISELSWTKRVAHPSEILKVGDMLDVVILSLDKESRKISLGAKQTQENPWKKASDKYNVGDRVKGKVRNLVDYGAFIELEDGIDGLLHVSDMSWTQKIQKASDFLKKGDELELMVLTVDTEAQKISLGLKQMSIDPWNDLTKDLLAGNQISGKVSRIVNFGLFVELENGLEGLVHISEIPDAKVQADVESRYKIGQEANCTVLNVDQAGRKISLALK